MYLHQLFITAVHLSICTAIQAQVIPFTSERWTISSRGHMIEAYEGVPNTLLLQNGIAWIQDANFTNGIIEFDIYLAERRGFPGVMFRMQDDINYEEFYLRPHLSGNPDAMQYTPVWGGNSAWQLYHDQSALVNNGRVSYEMKSFTGFNTIYAYPYDRWLHVKLVVSGVRADVYFDHEQTPTLQIRELRRGITSGGVGIKTGVSPFYFANFSFTPVENPGLTPIQTLMTTVDSYRISSWQVSQSFEEDKLINMYQLNPVMLDTLRWDNTDSEQTGLVNLSSLRSLIDRKLNTVLARFNISSLNSQTKRLDFGYSDRVKVYCNGQLLYAGVNDYLSRDYRYLGTIGYFDSVYLPLRAGSNEIVFAVSETFGGWGVQAKLEDVEGVELK